MHLPCKSFFNITQMLNIYSEAPLLPEICMQVSSDGAEKGRTAFINITILIFPNSKKKPPEQILPAKKL